MLNKAQILILAGLSVVLWAVAALTIRLFPAALGDTFLGGLSFVTTVLVAWLCVVVIRWAAKLPAEHLLAGVGIVGALAMMIDGAVLHWLPSLYGEDDTAIRFGAAWLLWGYGVSLGIAVLMVWRTARAMS